MPIPPLLGPDGDPCRGCGVPLAADQRYCLECGTRRGAPRVEFLELLAPAAPAAAGHEAPMAEEVVAQDAAWTLPSPRAAAALILATVVFGSAIGTTLGPATAGAGGRPNLTIVAGPEPAPAPAPPAPEPAREPPAAPDVGSSSVADTTSAATAPAPEPVQEPALTTPTPKPQPAPERPAPAPKVPPVDHVWLITLTGHSADETFGPTSPAPYLAQELRGKGTLLSRYDAIGHGAATGGVALLGGRRVGADGFAGPYPPEDATLPDRLTGAGKTWKAYVEGADDGLAPGDSRCSVAPDSRPRNPFLRFQSLTGDPACGSQIATADQLAADLADPGATPSFSWIVPGAEHDGTDLVAADAWLRTIVDPILASKAYTDDGGLIVITFDEGRADDVEGGGGRVGALLLSPFVAAGADVATPFDHLSLLRSIADLFGVEAPGDAAGEGVHAFDRKVYASWSQDVHGSATQRQHATG